MRRGRLPASTQPPAARKPKENPSPAKKVTNGDPFAALDAKVVTKGGDELSSRFPTLDQFSLLHDSGSKFEFDSVSAPAPAQQQTKDLSQRVSERLADEAFQTKPSPAPSQRHSTELHNRTSVYSSAPESKVTSPPLKSASAPPKPSEMSRASAIISSTPELQALSNKASQPLYQPAPTRPAMVSTGTMTSTPPPERSSSTQQYQIYRFPANEQPRASSVPRHQEAGLSAIRRTETPTSSSQQISEEPSFQPQSPAGSILSYFVLKTFSGDKQTEFGCLRAHREAPPVSFTSSTRQHSLESNMDYLRGTEGHIKAFGRSKRTIAKGCGKGPCRRRRLLMSMTRRL